MLPMTRSTLHDEKTFYPVFWDDLKHAQAEVIVESPFITLERVRSFGYIFEQLVDRDIRVYVITRNPKEHTFSMMQQSEQVIQYFESIGVQVLLCSGNDHRKLAMVDRRILWEGSLNILSQTKSREIMRRFDCRATCQQMFDFLKLENFL